MKRHFENRRLGPWCVSLAVLLVSAPVKAGELDTVIEAGSRKIQLAQASQERVDAVVDETQRLETEYRQVMKEIDGLTVYNDYMDRQIANQFAELTELRESIDRVSSVERQIMPLMIRMLDGLERFVELDIPFLKEERVDRTTRLRSLMERADVSVAEKFRRLTEAFQVENDFGRTIETYSETLEVEGATLEVAMLRLGRVGLYYQTTDASVTGHWDPAQRQFAALEGGEIRNQVRQGLRMARKQIAPDLLLLQVPAPEGAK